MGNPVPQFIGAVEVKLPILPIWISLCIMYNRSGLKPKDTALVEQILTTVWKKGEVQAKDLYNSLGLDEKRLNPIINFLIKFGFVELNDSDGGLALAPEMKILLKEVQSEAEESTL